MYRKPRHKTEEKNGMAFRVIVDVISTILHNEVKNMEINEMCFDVFLLYA